MESNMDGPSAPKQEHDKSLPAATKQLVVYTEFGYASVHMEQFVTQIESMSE